jgi:Ca2+-binding RTX toxin-like protein
MWRLGGVCALALLCMTGVGQATAVHAGWPTIGNLLIDKDTSGGSHVLRGAPGVHNELLGGYGSDTLYGGNAGDVIWADYHPDFSGYDAAHTYCPSMSAYIQTLTYKPKTPAELDMVRTAYRQSDAACRAQPALTGKAAGSPPPPQTAYIYAGNGNNFIYATDTTNFVWTGTGKTMVHASVGGGVIHCQSAKAIVFLSKRSRPHYRLPGCRHLSYFTSGHA